MGGCSHFLAPLSELHVCPLLAGVAIKAAAGSRRRHLTAASQPTPPRFARSGARLLREEHAMHIIVVYFERLPAVQHVRYNGEGGGALSAHRRRPRRSCGCQSGERK